VAVGVIRRPFGLGGQVFVHPDPDVDDAFSEGDVYGASPDPATASGPLPSRSLTVAASMLHRNMRVVRFEGVEDREAAAELRDLVLVRQEADGDLGEDDYWAEELVGRPVVDPQGHPLGTLRGVGDGVAHDYLIVAGQGRADVLVPAVAELVDVQPDRIVVQALPGLFDDPEHQPDGG